MTRENYLKLLTEQIRCAQARGPVQEEVLCHIEDQKEAFLAEGMTEEAAEKAAVAEMGDPVETGISLDRVHRPQMAWGLISLIGILSLLGVLFQYLQQSALQPENVSPFSVRQTFFTLLGFALMIGVCFVDYSRIAARARELFLILLAVLLAGPVFFGLPMNGAVRWIRFFNFSISLQALSLLFVPLYAAILYHYRGQGALALAKAALWAVPALYQAFIQPDLKLAAILYACFLITLTAAVWKKWFRVPRTITLTVLWGTSLLIPALFLWSVWNSEGYQSMRLKVFVNPGLAGEQVSYLQTLRTIGENSRLIGAAPELGAIPYFPQDPDYLLTYLAAYYGILAVAVPVALALFLLLRLLGSSLKQKNQLGMMMGFGCCTLFFTQLILYLLANFGYFPTPVLCPFFGYGGSGILASYLLFGILLSIYRYQNVLPAAPCFIRRMFRFRT